MRIIFVCVLKPGVHATLVGVAIALFIPIRSSNENGRSPLKEVEHGLAPWVAFGTMPIFAFANAGASLEGLSFTRSVFSSVANEYFRSV